MLVRQNAPYARRLNLQISQAELLLQMKQMQEPLSRPSTLQSYKERLRCVVGKFLFMQIRMQIGMQQWQRQKVSDAEQRIENRLAELHRSDILNQSYTPNVGNLNESPTITGGHRGADSSAKVQ